MRYDTCRTEVKDATMAMLTLGFPPELSGGGGQASVAPPQPSYGQAQPNTPVAQGGYRIKRQGGYGAPQPAVAPSGSGYGAPAPAPISSGYGAQPAPKPQPARPGKIFQPPTLPPKECGLVDFVRVFPCFLINFSHYYKVVCRKTERSKPQLSSRRTIWAFLVWSHRWIRCMKSLATIVNFWPQKSTPSPSCMLSKFEKNQFFPCCFKISQFSEDQPRHLSSRGAKLTWAPRWPCSWRAVVVSRCFKLGWVTSWNWSLKWWPSTPRWTFSSRNALRNEVVLCRNVRFYF